MPGTRTAPLMTATATSRQVSIRLIDASGDLYAEPLVVPVAATAAQVEAWVGAYAAASNASVYGVEDTAFREGDADPDNAVAAYRGSVKDGINLLFRDVANRQTFTDRVIAPVADAMQGNQDIPLLSSDELTNVITSILTLRAAYDFSQAQFTERRERTNNPRIR